MSRAPINKRIIAHLRSEAVRGITEFSRLQAPIQRSHSQTRHTVEVAIHTILYVRQVYPADLFVRRKKYETPVYQSRHPGLNEYIAGAVKAIGDELALVSTSTLCAPRRHKHDLFFNTGER